MIPTFEQLLEKYMVLVDYTDDGDIAKARELRTVCHQLLVVLPVRTRGANQEIEMNVAAVKGTLDEVTAWIAKNESIAVGGTRSSWADLRRYRG